jgi:uncharacterized protein DUF6904
MLTGTPTPFGAGIELLGDRLDLHSLHRTIHALCDEAQLTTPWREFNLGLAYDVRKAVEGSRNRRPMEVDGDESVDYFGVEILWPYFLVQSGLLRHAAGRRVSTKRDQVNVRLLELIAEEALCKADPKAGGECVEWFRSFAGFPAGYYMEFINRIARDYACVLAPEKRFGCLPILLRRLDPSSSEYQGFAGQLKREARVQRCSAQALAEARDWPDFKW